MNSLDAKVMIFLQKLVINYLQYLLIIFSIALLQTGQKVLSPVKERIMQLTTGRYTPFSQ